MGNNPNLYIIIIGCGRVGSHVANKLSVAGNSVVVVDIKKTAFNHLSAEFSGFKVEGDAAEFAVLKEAKTEKADILVATTPHDNVNVMVCQVAKKIFKVPLVIGRLTDPEREEIYKKLDIKTVCPTILAGSAFLETIENHSEEEEA